MAALVDHFQGLLADAHADFVSPDPRTVNWMWLATPYPTAIATVFYLTVVHFGPKLMANREPFGLRNFSIAYNFSMVALSAYMCFELLYTAYMLNFSMICEPLDKTDGPFQRRMAGAIWWYYFSKFIEFTDTFLMILRKKNNQVTFLHVYHHVSMFWLWWLGTRTAPVGQLWFGPMINCVIHMFMYYYYACTAAGVKVWWKHWMTRMQLIQFFMTIFHAISGLTFSCGHPKWMLTLLTTYMCSLVVLFTNFYLRTYTMKKPARKEADKEPMVTKKEE